MHFIDPTIRMSRLARAISGHLSMQSMHASPKKALLEKTMENTKANSGV